MFHLKASLNVSASDLLLQLILTILHKLQRRPSITDSQRQGSLEVATVRSAERRAAERQSSESFRRSKSRPASPDKHPAFNREKYPSSETLSERRSSSEFQSIVVGSNVVLMKTSDSGFRSRDEYSCSGEAQLRKKSYSASESSLDEGNGDLINETERNSKRRKSRKSKIYRQRKANEDTESDPILFYQTDDEQSKNKRNMKKEAFQLPLTYQTSLRHISSEAAIYSTQSNTRRQSDSQSSDISDMRIMSPPADSLSPSSPDYSHSPRQSADSDQLGLRECLIFLS